MPGLLMHVNAACLCTHAGPATIVPTQPRVLVSGQPVAQMTSPIVVAGCAFTIPGPKPQPCVTVKWLLPSARVLVVGQPAMLIPAPGTGPGLCQSAEQIPQGPPIVGAVQPRVIAT
jgi:hypothetical protein